MFMVNTAFYNKALILSKTRYAFFFIIYSSRPCGLSVMGIRSNTGSSAAMLQQRANL